jgi:hypothetical protein
MPARMEVRRLAAEPAGPSELLTVGADGGSYLYRSVRTISGSRMRLCRLFPA